MSRRWIRLDAEWEESDWLDGLSGESSGCWPRLLCWVKLRGKRGRCTAPTISVLARRWKVSKKSVEALLAAARADKAIAIEGDELIIANWPEYQEPDQTATERKRRQRSKGHAYVTPGHDVTLSRDHRPLTTKPTTSCEGFEELWAVCKRGSKRLACNQYRRVVPVRVSHESLLAAWKSHVSSASEPKYVAHLFRWIRDERWEESPPPANNGTHPSRPASIPFGEGSAARILR